MRIRCLACCVALFCVVSAHVALSDGPSPLEVFPLHPRLGFELAADERDQFRLFPDVPGFVSARVVGAEGQYRLQLVFEQGGRMFFREEPFSSDAWKQIRELVDAAEVSTATRSPEGRLRLVAHATLYGAIVYGSGIAELFELESTRAEVAATMLGSGAGFVGSMLATRDYTRGAGHAKMLGTASYIGFYYGLIPELWVEVGEPDRFDGFSEERERRQTVRRRLGMMGGVALGTLAMDRLLRDQMVTDGEADLTFIAALHGAAYGLGIPYLLGADRLNDAQRGRVYLASTAAAVPLVAYTGFHLARDRALSSGHAGVVTLASLLGVYYGGTLVRLFDGDEVADSGKPYVLAGTLGSWTGVVTALSRTRSESYSRTRAGLLTVGSIAGGLIGAGTVFVLTDAHDARPYLAASSVGSAVALLLTHRATRSPLPAPSETP